MRIKIGLLFVILFVGSFFSNCVKVPSQEFTTRGVPVIYPGNIPDETIAEAMLDIPLQTKVNAAYDPDLQTLASPTNWRVFYSNGSATITEFAFGASGLFLKSQGASSAPIWDSPSGSGDVTAVGDAASGETFTADGIGNSLYFEGSTADEYEIIITAADIASADKTVTFRDASGTVLLSGDTLTGDVTATFDTDGSTATTIAADSVALTTDTTGNYVTSITNGSGITGGDGGSEGATLTIAATLGTSIDTTEITNATITEDDIKVVNAASDEDIFSYESTTGDFEWHTLSELGIEPALTDEASLYSTLSDVTQFYEPSDAATFGNLQTGENGSDGQVTIFSEQGGTDYSVVFQPHATMTQTTTYLLPPNDGDAAQVLHTDGSGNLTWDSDDGAGGGAPVDATYITQIANGTLTNEQVLSALTTGLMITTNGTGIVTTTTDNSTNWDTAYSHSQDNTQAHTDYLLNTGADTLGTGSGFALTFDAGATDPTFTFGSDSVAWTNAATFTIDGAQVQTGSDTVLKDLVTTSPLTGGTDDILPGSDSDVTIALTVAKDLVTTSPLTGGTDDIFTGADSDITLAITVAKDLVTTSPLSGGTDNIFTGTDSDITLSIADADDDGTTKGAASFDNADFNATSGNVTIVDDGHAHTTTSISGVDISADTNLVGGTGVTLTDDTLSVDLGTAIDTSEITDATITEADLKVVDTASDEDIFTFESTTGDFEWHTAAELGVGTATSITDDLIVKADFADEDWGDVSVSSNTVTLDTDVIAAAEMADADHGDVSWSSGVASVEDLTIASEAQGDVLYYNGSNWVRLAKGSAGQILEMNSGATAPEWDVDDTGGSTAWDDIGDPDADATIAFAGYEQIISTSLDEAAHAALKIDHTDADVIAATTLLQIQSVDDADVDLTYIRIIDNSGVTPNTVFSVGADGVIANDGNITSLGTIEGATLTEGGTGVYNTTQSDAAYQPLETTLTDIADGTIAENLVNTTNPWADNEVADTLTIDGSSTVDNGALDADLQTLATPTNWRVFYSNGSATVIELALGSSGQYLKSQGASSIPAWDTPGGSGDITDVGDASSGATFTADGTGNSLYFEGSSADEYETILTAADTASSDKTVTLRDASGTVLLSGDTLTGDVTATFDTDGSTATTIAADSVALTTDTSGNYVLDVADGTGIDGTAAGEGATYTPTLDLTEVTSNVSWNDGATDASFTWTYNLNAGTDPVWTIGDGSMDLTAGTLKVGGSAVQTGSDTIAKDLVTTAPLTGGTDDILPGADADITLAITIAKDIVTTAPLTGGTDNILPGADADITIAMPAATTSQDGYITQTDWDTFNDHAADSTQAHSDYLLNTGADTLGTGSGFALTFDAGATDPIVTFGSDSVAWTNSATFTVDGAQVQTGSDTIAKDLVTTAPLTGGTDDILPGADADITIAITIAKDIVTTAPLTGGTDNILPGADADITIAMPAATTSQDGYITQTDWDTFNDHAADSTQAHSDYVLNTGADTLGVGSGFALTFDAGATDPTITFASDSVVWTNVATFTVDGAQVQTGTDDDVPEAGDFGAATDLDSNGALNTGSVADNEIDYSAVTFADFDYQTAWRVFYSNTDGDVTELALGADGTYLMSNGAAAAPTFETPGGSGDITAVGDGATGDVFTADGTGNNLYFEGSSADDYETILTAADTASSDKTVTLRDATGTVLISGDTLTGDVTATFDTDGSTATTIAADSVALTTDTTGNYAAGDGEAGAALTGDTATAFFSAGTIEHEYGGLEADVSGYAGILKITGGTTSAVTIGIADDNQVEIDDADAADDDFAKLTANGLEGRSYAETLADIGAEAALTDEASLYTTLSDVTQFYEAGDNITFTDQDASPSSAGELTYDNTVTGLEDGALAWYDDDAVRYLVDLDTLPSTDDYVVAYDADNDEFYMKEDTEGVGGGSSRWTDEGTFSRTDDNTISITTADCTNFQVGTPVRFSTDESTWFYAMVDTCSDVGATINVDIFGHPIEVDKDDYLNYGIPEALTHIQLAGVGNCSVSDVWFPKYFWTGQDAYLIMMYLNVDTQSTGSALELNVELNGVNALDTEFSLPVSTTQADSGTTIDDTTYANALIEAEEFIEISVSQCGSTIPGGNVAWAKLIFITP